MLKNYFHFVWLGLSHLPRIVRYSLLLLALAGAGVVLGLRYWVLPGIEQYHDKITSSISLAVGQPVTIARVEADWQGVGPHLRLTDIRILSKQGDTVLTLQRVDIVVSWMTLLAGELRLASLEIDKPELLIRRDAQGALQISGIPLTSQSGPETRSSGTEFSNMLLQQSSIVVRDARIGWLDEKNAAPLLLFRDVNLLIRNTWHHHRFALRASPPAELSTQLDVRGDLFGNTIDDVPSWSGEIFTQLDYADVGAWKTWLKLPAAFKRGKGALRGWLGIEEGRISHVTTDLALANVQTRLADDLPALEIRTLRGRAAWRSLNDGFEVSTRNLALKLFSGFELRPTNFLLSLSSAGEGGVGRGAVRANFLELADFGTLMEYLPLDPGLKQQFAEYAPNGRIENLRAQWESAPDKALQYELKARFDKLAMHRVGSLPGFSGLSGEVDGTDSGGTLSVQAHDFKIDAPQFMPETLAFDSFTAQSSWESYGERLEVKLSNISVVNDDLEGNAYGSYQSVKDSLGKIDLTVHLTRASVPRIQRYIPLLALGDDARTWMKKGLLDGASREASVRLKGDLRDFPFEENKKGMFKVHVRAKGVAVEYAPGWPRVEGATADFLLQGKRMEITVPTATTAGARLQKISVTMPDMLSDNLSLNVSGEQEGDIARCLEFLHKIPVRGSLSDFVDGVTAHGNGKLQLQLAIPLLGPEPVKLAGRYYFAGDEVDFGKHIPTLRDVVGELQFTEATVLAKNLSAQILGGPATLALESGAGGAISAKLSGTANLDSLRKRAPRPILQKLRGSMPWDMDIAVQDKQSSIVLNSNLLGLQSDLPEPFSKKASESIALHFEQNSSSAQLETSLLQYGNWLKAKFVRQPDARGVWSIKRGKVMLGNAVRAREPDGIWIEGILPELSLDGWGAIWGELGNSSTAGVNIAGADVRIQSLNIFGSSVKNFHLRASSQHGVLTTHLAAREINGDLSWHPQENGKLVARLANLNLGESESQASKKSAPEKELVAESKNAAGQGDASKNPVSTMSLPALDMVIDRLSVKGRHMGKFELQTRQQGEDYLLQQVRLSNPDAVLSADGRWKMQAGAEQTQVNLRLEISNAGNILSRYGYPDSVRNGSGELEGSFSWPGAPQAFSYAALDGNLHLATGKGQFMQIEPGVGKLLGIMSLQALPRHLTLDFDDVIRKGFEFEKINGTASIRHGLMLTNDFKIEGSAAKVTMTGQVDLNHETQNLHVKVLPSIGSSVSLLSFAAGPAVGVGVYLTNKLLRDPLDKLVAIEYNVTGSWAEPKVDRLDRRPFSPQFNPAEIMSPAE